MKREDLTRLVGFDSVEELEKIFADRYDEIVIRRCEEHGKFINFHTDVSLKTMQVALNEDYKGGDLLYICNGGNIEAPERKTGTITIHYNDIVHGVTLLEEGTRYGLFFLKKHL